MGKKGDEYDQILKLLRSIQGEQLKHVVERVFQKVPTLASKYVSLVSVFLSREGGDIDLLNTLVPKIFIMIISYRAITLRILFEF